MRKAYTITSGEPVFRPSVFIKNFAPHLLSQQFHQRCILSLIPAPNKYIEYTSVRKISFALNTTIFQYDQPVPFSLIYTGIGAPVAAMILEILIELGIRQIIVIGTCGILSKDIQTGDIIIPDRFIRDEGTSFHYLPQDTKIRSNNTLNTRMVEILKQNHIPFYQGLHWTTDAPFRENSQKISKFNKRGCLSVDMESSALFAVAQHYKKHIAALLIGSDILTVRSWTPPQPSSRIVKDQTKQCINIILKTFLSTDLPD